MSLDHRKVPPHPLSVVGSRHGMDIQEAVLRSPGGIEARVLSYGAIIRDLSVPLADGTRQSQVLGYDDIAGYLSDPNYFGALVGRYANRIAGGRFTVDGTTHDLDRNEQGKTTLHGGSGGFSTRNWTIVELTATRITLRLISPDGDQGFPGELTATCRYEVCDSRGLVVDVRATTNRATPVSLAQHSYFTLGAQDVRELLLTVHSDHYVPVSDDLIPTGALCPVDATPFDFRSRRRVGAVPGGLDHTFVLRGGPDAAEGPRLVAVLENPLNGRALEIETTQPGLQIYDGAMIRSPSQGPGLSAHSGICAETQAFPDSPNCPAFPDSVLRPGQTYAQTTIYRFTFAT
jgi:aldose 1-epimerase